MKSQLDNIRKRLTPFEKKFLSENDSDEIIIVMNDIIKQINEGFKKLHSRVFLGIVSINSIASAKKTFLKFLNFPGFALYIISLKN